MSKPDTGSHSPSPGYDPAPLIAMVYRKLDNLGFRPVVIGGQAVIYHGHVRHTGDVDFSIDAFPDRVDDILKHLPELDCQSDVSDAVLLARQAMILPLLHPAADYGVDISFTPTEYFDSCYERAVEVIYNGQAVKVLGVEDTVIHKVVAGRSQDQIDAIELLSQYPNANDFLMRDWINQFAQVLEQPLIERYESWRAEALP